jgi:hypothetical protein
LAEARVKLTRTIFFDLFSQSGGSQRNSEKGELDIGISSTMTKGERRMPVKFSYDTQVGLRVETDFDSELSREEAMVVAVRDLASGMHSLSQAVWELYDEFRFKQSSKRVRRRAGRLRPRDQRSARNDGSRPTKSCSHLRSPPHLLRGDAR